MSDMGTGDTLTTVTQLRSAAFDLLAATTRRGPDALVSECVDHLQAAANELGRVEELLGRSDRPVSTLA